MLYFLFHVQKCLMQCIASVKKYAHLFASSLRQNSYFPV